MRGLAVIGIVAGAVLGLIILGVYLPVGMWAYYSTYDVIEDLDLGATGNATRTALNTNIWSGFNLFTVSPVVVAAGGLITIVLVAFVVAFAKGYL